MSHTLSMDIYDEVHNVVLCEYKYVKCRNFILVLEVHVFFFSAQTSLQNWTVDQASSIKPLLPPMNSSYPYIAAAVLMSATLLTTITWTFQHRDTLCCEQVSLSCSLLYSPKSTLYVFCIVSIWIYLETTNY